MDVVTLRVRGFNKRKDFHFSITEEAAKFQKCLEDYDADKQLSYEVLSGSIENNAINIRELGRKPEVYAEKAWKELKGRSKK